MFGAQISKKNWISLGVLFGSIFLSFVLYWGTLHGDFVVDDVLFNQRQDYRDTSHLLAVWNEPYLMPSTAIYRPLASFTFVVNYVVFGDDPTSFHVFNLILNGIATWLVFVLIYRLFKNYWLSFFSTLFFALQPFHRIPAGNIKNRDETLAAIFTILAVLAFLKAREYFKQENKKKNVIWMAVSAFCALLALASKEMAIAAPLIVLAVYWLEEKPKLWQLVKMGLWYVPLTALFMLQRWHVLGEYMFANDAREGYTAISLGAEPRLTQFWTAGRIAYIYLSKMFVPINLSMDYSFNHVHFVQNILKAKDAIAGFLMLAGLIFLATLKKEKYRPLVYGALLFLIPYFFVSKFVIKYGGQTMEENWMYLPSLGISIIVGYMFMELRKYAEFLAVAAVVAMVAAYSYVDISSNQMWLDAYHISLDRVQNSPDSADAHYSLAMSYAAVGDSDNAVQQLQMADAIFPIPKDADLYGMLAVQRGDFKTAASFFQKAVNEGGDVNMGMHYSLALTKLGKYQQSIDLVMPWHKAQPDVDQWNFVLALDYYKMGNIKEAEKYLDYSPGADSVREQLLELETW